MIRTLLDRDLLACPTCRGADDTGDGGFVDHPLYLDQPLLEEGDFVVQGLLACPNCRTRYPIVDGVAIVMRDVGEWLKRQETAVFSRADLDPTLENWLLSAWDDTQDRNWRRQMISIYARDHAASDVDHDDAEFRRALRDQARISQSFLTNRRATLVDDMGEDPIIADLGCAVGRSSIDLASNGATVIAIDNDFGVLRLLATLLRRGAVTAPRWRHAGYDYVPVELTCEHGLPVVPVAADATDPPLRAGTIDAITAYNLLDNIADPVLLIRQIWGTLRPGGRFICSSPYDWVSAATPRWNRLGESIRIGVEQPPDAAQALRDLLTGQMPGLAPGVAFEIELEREHQPWLLERHDRSFHVFLTHYIEANKPS